MAMMSAAFIDQMRFSPRRKIAVKRQFLFKKLTDPALLA
jgi:hypothetical protein